MDPEDADPLNLNQTTKKDMQITLEILYANISTPLTFKR